MDLFQKIIISRTDNIGDVILTLPLAGVIKKQLPGCEVSFLGNSYTKPIIESSEFIDKFLDWDELSKLSNNNQIKAFKEFKSDAIIHVFPDKKIAFLAKKAGIPLRIGTSHRWYHFLYCNNLINLGRRNSSSHEAQLNLNLLSALNIKYDFPVNELSEYYGFRNIDHLKDEFKQLLSQKRCNIILHPKSKGSAREWGIDNFNQLVNLLPKEKFKIFITGTEQEGQIIRDFLDSSRNKVIDLTGKMNLSQLISFIGMADGLVAASTGPLHIAAALGKFAIGLYAPIRPLHPGRWSPIGRNARYLVLDKKCDLCRRTLNCKCIRSIRPESVLIELQEVYKKIDRLI